MKFRMLIFCLFFSPAARAQLYQPVFPDLTGEPLLTALRQDYKPATVLDFGNARDTLFARVYAHNDSLTCVYSGHTLYLDPAQDPTSFAYQNGALWGINTEHTWPRAKGADSGNPRADMHHLYPTRIAVNAARANLPFAEVDDQQTQEWFYLTFIVFSTPAEHIERYSELGANTFEPREDHKGNVARAMFYFYTMYRQEADQADPGFFEPQRVTLCEWHYQDPVDPIEWDRNWLIAGYQDGKPNPFVLDCTLAARTYCQDVDLNCDPVSVSAPERTGPVRLFNVSPNPIRQQARISCTLDRPARITLTLIDLNGRPVTEIFRGDQAAGRQDYLLEPAAIGDLSNGVFFCRLQVDEGRKKESLYRKLVLQP